VLEIIGGQQSDAWLRARVGRITGSRIADVCSYLTRASGNKKAGDPSAKRDDYMDELIAERLTGRSKDHYNSPAMQRGSELEDDARLYYEAALKVMVEPVSFVVHQEHDFTGASPDGLVGDDGILEVKCLLPWNHIYYVRTQTIPEEYLPQIQWEMACTGRQWVDLVLYCPEIIGADSMRFFYRRIERDDEQIAKYTAEVLKLNAEIEAFMREHDCRPVAPFPVDLKELPEQSEADAYAEAIAVLDASIDMTP